MAVSRNGWKNPVGLSVVEKEYLGCYNGNVEIWRNINMGNTDKRATIIYLVDSMLLSKNKYSDWKEIQADYEEKYKMNLVALTCDEIIGCGEKYLNLNHFSIERLIDVL